MIKYLIPLLLFFLPIGCYEDQEGCLDILASNFDVSADEDCCCTYPNLNLSYRHEFGDSNFVRGEWYLNNLNQVFRVDTFRMYWHNINIRNIADESFNVLDTITISQELQRDDYVLIDIRNLSTTIGAFSPSDTFTNISFDAGIGQDINLEDLTVEAGHPLSALNGIFDQTNGYSDLELKITTDSIQENALLIRFNFESAVNQSYPIDVFKEAGSVLSLSFKIDYSTLLGTFDFGQLDSLNLINHIKSTWSESIFFD